MRKQKAEFEIEVVSWKTTDLRTISAKAPTLRELMVGLKQGQAVLYTNGNMSRARFVLNLAGMQGVFIPVTDEANTKWNGAFMYVALWVLAHMRGNRLRLKFEEVMGRPKLVRAAA